MIFEICVDSVAGVRAAKAAGPIGSSFALISWKEALHPAAGRSVRREQFQALAST